MEDDAGAEESKLGNTARSWQLFTRQVLYALFKGSLHAFGLGVMMRWMGRGAGVGAGSFLSCRRLWGYIFCLQENNLPSTVRSLIYITTNMSNMML